MQEETLCFFRLECKRHTLKPARKWLWFFQQNESLLTSNYEFNSRFNRFVTLPHRGVNFINMLTHSLYTCRSQKHKKTVKSSVEKSYPACCADVLHQICALRCAHKFDEIDPYCQLLCFTSLTISVADLLINQGKSCLLSWLQQVLLDACYAKLSGSNIQTPDGELLEPVPHYYNSK